MSLLKIYVLIAGWLAPDVTNNTLATCKYCRVELKAHKKDLVSHAKTDKHKKTQPGKNQQRQLNLYLKYINQPYRKIQKSPS